MYKVRIVKYIREASELALLLEVSAYPKPGNVHRLKDFLDTRYEHFLASSIAIGYYTQMAAIRGMKIREGSIGYHDAEIGKLIKLAVKNILRWHKGGNTHFGALTLFIPLSVALGVSLSNNLSLDLETLKTEFDNVVKATTVNDALEFYKAIFLVRPGGLGRVTGYPDIYDRRSLDIIRRENMTLYNLMKISSEWDMVAHEFVNKLKISIDDGYPYIIKIYKETKDVNIALVHAFLYLLSRHPDTLVAKKVGLKYSSDPREALKIGMKESLSLSNKAGYILKLGGLLSQKGKKELYKLDDELAVRNLNPGSTADILATSIYIALIKGFRF